jgi:O-antigen ligase
VQYNSPNDDTESIFRIRRKPWPYQDESFSEAARSNDAPERFTSTLSQIDRPSHPNIQPTLKRSWIRPRGHSLSFICLFAFTAILYFRPYELIPAFASFTSIAFYCGVLTLVVFLITQISTEGNLTVRPREVNLALLLVVAALLSVPMAINPAEAWQTFTDTFIKAVLIFIVFVNVVRTERRLKLLILLALGVSTYLSIRAIYDYQHGIFAYGNAQNNSLRIAGSIGGLFENSNDLALHLCTMVPIVIVMVFAERGLLKRLGLGVIGVLMIAGIVVTFSRGGFLALFLSGMVLALKLGRKNTMLTVVAVFVGIILFVALLPGGYSGRLETILYSSADLTGSASQRTEVLKRSIAVALRYPIFGVGIGNFHYKSVHELQTHNAYTQVAAEMGIAALVVYLTFLISPLRRLREIERKIFEQGKATHFYYMSIGLQTSLIAYMVASFFGAVAYQWYVYYLVGYAVAFRQIYYATISESPAPQSSAKDLSEAPLIPPGDLLETSANTSS